MATRARRSPSARCWPRSTRPRRSRPARALLPPSLLRRRLSPRSSPPSGHGSSGASVRPPEAHHPRGNGKAGVLSHHARRLVERLHIDPAKLTGTGPDGLVLREDVEAAVASGTIAFAGGLGSAAAPAGPAVQYPPLSSEAKITELKGSTATLASYMDQSLTIPVATSFRTLHVGTLEQRRAELNAALKRAGRTEKISFTHIIAFALARAAHEQPAITASFRRIEGKPQKVEAGIHLGLAVDAQRKDGSRFLVVPVLKNAAALDFAQFRAAYDDLVAKARDNKLSVEEQTGATFTLTNPGGIGTVASVPRLMIGQGAIIATGAIAYPPGFAHASRSTLEQLGVEKVMTMTSTYDHRVIQGAQSGEFLKRVDELLAGAAEFYETLFAQLGVAASVRASATSANGAPPATRDDAKHDALQRTDERRGRGRSVRRDAARDRRGDGDRLGVPPPRPPRRDARPPRFPAARRSVARPGDVRPHALDAGGDPRLDPARQSRGEHARRRAPCAARDVQLDDRLRDRAHLERAAARVAARLHRERTAPPCARAAAQSADPPASHQGRDDGALLPQAVHVAEDLLRRRARRDDPDARGDDLASRRGRDEDGRARDGPPRPSGDDRARGEPTVRRAARRVRVGLGARSRRRGRRCDGRREVPPRCAWSVRDAGRDADHRRTRAQPLAPRGGRRRRRRDDARPADASRREPSDAQHRSRRADPDPRRRRVRRARRRRRSPEPAGPRRLRDRRNDPRHLEQPGRLHHRSVGSALDALRLGPRERLRPADRARQRRRRRSLDRRGPSGDRLPPQVRARRRRRPDRLSSLRPQRAGRARRTRSRGCTRRSSRIRRCASCTPRSSSRKAC